MNFVTIFLLFLSVAWSQAPIDIVFDIDQTIGTKIHEGPYGDFLADPKNPTKGLVDISYLEEGKKVQEKYRIYEGVEELMEKLRPLQDQGKIRISFYSGGGPERNEALLKAIKLKQGTLLDLVGKRHYGRDTMVATGLDETHRIRDRFKKNLKLINPDLNQVVMIDDIRNFVLDSQLDNVLWVDYDFPYPERKGAGQQIIPSRKEIAEEKTRFKKISEIVLSSIEKHETSQLPIANISRTMYWGCSSENIYRTLNHLLSR